MNLFKLECKSCGSDNIDLIIEEEVVFNGEGYESVNTGNIEIICKECKDYELIKGGKWEED